jgi:hypothetical protein
MEGSMRNMINLLPASYRRQQLIRKRAVQWSSIVCLVMLSGWAWHWYERREDLALSQQLESLQREHAPTQTMLRQLVKMRQQLDDSQHQEAVARELEHQRNALTLLGVIGETTRAADGRLRVTKLELTGFQDKHSSESRATQINASSGLLLGGVSLDNPSVAELLEGLQDSGIFSRVELQTLKGRENSETSMRDYEVRCEF